MARPTFAATGAEVARTALCFGLEWNLALLTVGDRLQPFIVLVIEAALPGHRVTLLPTRLLERLYPRFFNEEDAAGWAFDSELPVGAE